MRKRHARDIVLQLVGAVGQLEEAGLRRVLLHRVPKRLGQRMDRRRTDVHLDVRRHLPIDAAVEQRDHPVGHEGLELLPVLQGDFGAGRDGVLHRPDRCHAEKAEREADDSRQQLPNAAHLEVPPVPTRKLTLPACDYTRSSTITRNTIGKYKSEANITLRAAAAAFGLRASLSPKVSIIAPSATATAREIHPAKPSSVGNAPAAMSARQSSRITLSTGLPRPPASGSMLIPARA